MILHSTYYVAIVHGSRDHIMVEIKLKNFYITKETMMTFLIVCTNERNDLGVIRF